MINKLLWNNEERHGCGSGIFFIKDCFYKEACKQHDIDYSLGKLSQKNADYKFLCHMKHIYKDKEGGVLQYIKIYIYYAVVRLFGFIFYKKNPWKQK